MKKTLLFFLFSIVTTAQSLDATFGDNGVLPEYGNTVNSTQIICDVAVQNNILCHVGYVKRKGFVKGIVLRYDGMGSYLTKEIGSVALQTVCFQTDDKIITAGRNKIYRILPDNNFDTSFNTSGSQTINFGTYPMNIKCISVQTDGKIVVSGYVSNGTNNDFAIARLNVDGSFDTTFDSDGMKTIAIGTSNEQAFSHKIQNDGKIVVVGESFITNYDFAIVRLNTNGSLDVTFNGTGKKTMDYTSSIDRARSFEILPDGKIVIFGQIAGAFACVKLNANGSSLDSSFGNFGTGYLALPDLLSMSTGTTVTSAHLIPKIKILPDGKMVLNGTSNDDVKFIKLHTNGLLDNTFGTNGVVVVNNDIDNASSFYFNGTDVIRFIATTTSATSNGNFKIFNGSISDNGLTVVSNTGFFYEENYFKDFQVLPDGKIIAVVDKQNLSVIKYNSDGSIDTTFGNNGIVLLTNSPSNGPSLKIRNDGKIIIGDNSIYRLNIDGSFDTSFNGTGVFDIETITNGKMTHSDAIYLADDNKILLSCEYETTIQSSTSSDFILGYLRINENGSIDSNYGTNGFFYTKIHPYSNQASLEYADNILIQSDNKKIMVGISYPYPYSTAISFNSFVQRMNVNDTVDTSYGTNGLVYFPSVIGDFNVNDSYILANDKLLLNFVSSNSSKTTKLNIDGSLDTTFGVNGVSSDVFGTMNYAMTVQPDGKILKSGSKNGQFSISCYNTNGSIDTTFGVNGEVTVGSLGIDTDWGFAESSFSKIIIQPDGKIIAGGDTFDGYYQLSTLVRLTNATLGTMDFSSTKNALSIYPNPIETNATFEFTLENSENITIELYDVQGRLVQTIATNKQMAAGNHNLPIELNQSLTSGNYFLKLATVSGSQTIQIIKK